jgi:hypothetical protein
MDLTTGSTDLASQRVRDLVAAIVDERIHSSMLPLISAIQSTSQTISDVGVSQQRSEAKMEELQCGLKLVNDRTATNEATLAHLTQLTATNVALVQRLAELQLNHNNPGTSTHPTPSQTIDAQPLSPQPPSDVQHAI